MYEHELQYVYGSLDEYKFRDYPVVWFADSVSMLICDVGISNYMYSIFISLKLY